VNLTTLIPAYKPAFLKDLLRGLQVQTRPSQRIVFSDDSPGGAYRAALMSDALAPLRQGLPIEVVEGPRRGGYANIQHLVKLWNGSSDLVHVMLDDDIVYPSFYERHRLAHASGAISCSISDRWTTDELGQPIGRLPVPALVQQSSERMLSLSADALFKTTAVLCTNWFGEFSNTVFTPRSAAVLLKPEFEGISYAGLWDLGAFLAASLQAPVGYIQEALGGFRTSPQGNSAHTYGPYMKAAVLAYGALCLGGQRLGRYNEAQARSGLATVASVVQQYYAQQADIQPFMPLLARLAAGDLSATAEFIELWNRFLQSHDF
jgi:hypothetical protein